jgi:hypothetical protein
MNTLCRIVNLLPIIALTTNMVMSWNDSPDWCKIIMVSSCITQIYIHGLFYHSRYHQDPDVSKFIATVVLALSAIMAMSLHVSNLRGDDITVTAVLVIYTQYTSIIYLVDETWIKSSLPLFSVFVQLSCAYMIEALINYDAWLLIPVANTIVITGIFSLCVIAVIGICYATIKVLLFI